MFVKDYMTRHPIMIEPHKRVIEAQRLMVENKIRHLPVVGAGKRLLGWITRQRLQVAPERLASLEVWEITRYLAELTVEKVMVKGNDLKTIDGAATLETAADVMIRHKIGGLPVIEDGMVVGVITETDLLIQLRDLLGAFEAGWRVTVRVPDKDGEFSRLSSAVWGQGWSIMSMGGVRSPKTPGYWDAVLKVTGCDKEELKALVDSIEGQEVLDIRKTNYTS
jgi:acetoin utilization protein AcuB